MALRLAAPLRFAASVATLALMASAANASSFAIRSGQSAEGLGMAYAGAASGGIGLGAMAWNPAVITMFAGRQSQWNATYLKANASYELTRPSTLGGPVNPPFPLNTSQLGTGEIGLNGALIPASYNAWQLSDRLWVGLTTGAPYGLRSKPSNQTYAGQVYGRSASVRTLNVSPTIGFKINDWISVGAALQIQYAQADLKQALGIAGTAPGAFSAQIRGDSYDFGYRVGVTLTPFKGTTLGIAYRSGIDQTLRGQFRNQATGAIIPVSLNLPLPGSVVVGLSQVINDQWTVHAGVEWTNWSRFNRLPVRARANGALVTSLNFEYDDSWYFSGGVEYKWNQALTLRAGIGYELSAVNDRNRTLFISDNDRLWLSAGMSYKFNERFTFDLGYTYIAVNKASVNYNPNHPQWNPAAPVYLAAEAKPNIHVVSAALTYRWDDPTVAIPAAAVRK
jgi:long-chain fatty acid transport protein